MGTKSTVIHVSARPDAKWGRYLAILVVFSLFLSALVQLLHFQLDGGVLLRWIVDQTDMYIGSSVVVLVVAVFLFSALGNLGAGCLLCSALLLGMGYVDYLLMHYRHEPFYPRELSMAWNIGSLAGMVTTGNVLLMVSVLVVLGAVLVVLYCKSPHKPLAARVRWGLLLTSGSLLVVFCTAGVHVTSTRWVGKGAVLGQFDAFASYHTNGFILSFLSQSCAPLMVRPEGYSQQGVSAVVTKYKQQAQQYNAGLPEIVSKQPNIVFVMSESFSDPTSFAELTFSGDPIANIREMMMGYPYGTILTPGYGGGTAHCEFEALTGFSTALCGGVSPYENGVGDKAFFPSIAHTVKEVGYTTTALHPYHSGMYNRPDAYKAMGFDNFMEMQDMSYSQGVERSRYISDQAAYSQVLDLLSQSVAPSFVHLVTMQNHGGYTDRRTNNTIAVDGVDGADKESLETYTQGLVYTDRATKDFFAGLEELGEDTVVVFWGDHLPMGYPEQLTQGYGRQNYQTPFFIRATFPLPNITYTTRSPMFLQTILAGTTGIRQSPFAAQLMALEEELHGIHLQYMIDKDDRTLDPEKLTTQAKQRLEELYLIQYDMLVGEGYSQRAGYFCVAS